jgi:hypothetical protein
MRTAIAVGLVLALGACGGEDDPPDIADPPDLTVAGVSVYLHSDAPWLADPDLPAQLEGAMAAAAWHFGGALADLAGWSVVFQDEVIEGPGELSGMTYIYERRIVVRADRGTSPECSALPHEVGHVILGAGHEDARYGTLDATVLLVTGSMC